MGQDVVTTTGAKPVVKIDLQNLNFGGVKTLVEKYINTVGGASFSNRFPGSQIGFKKGIWSKGYKSDAPRLPSGTKLVFNIPNMIAGWRTFEENDAGKTFPVYSDMAMPFLGQDLVGRDTLGKDDKDDWDADQQGNPLDPWSSILVFPVREEDGDSYDHICLSSKSSCIAGFNLFVKVVEEMRTRPGQLPIISLGADKAEKEIKTTDKKGKEKKTQLIWDVPTFAVVAWVSATELDNAPNAGGVEVTDDAADVDLGKVNAKARVAPEEPNTKASASKKVRKTVSADDTL